MPPGRAAARRLPSLGPHAKAPVYCQSVRNEPASAGSLTANRLQRACLRRARLLPTDLQRALPRGVQRNSRYRGRALVELDRPQVDAGDGSELLLCQSLRSVPQAEPADMEGERRGAYWLIFLKRF
jgi:hypothetical protein